MPLVEMQYRHPAHLHVVENVPWGPSKVFFLLTLLSQIFPDSDLSQPIGTLDWTGHCH